MLGAEVVFADADFAALRVAGQDVTLHADHTYDRHAWWPELAGGGRRGLGAEVRLLGLDPEQTHARAVSAGARVLSAPWHTPHGWHETTIEDPDGYAWAVGVKRAD